MKALYAVQGTGNGHIARACEIIPILSKRVELDVMVTGIQADLKLPFPVKYSYRGLSFIFGKSGGVDIASTYKAYKVRDVWKEIRNCPVDDYDIVINDFEPISAWACKLKGVKCIGLSHQGALRSRLVPKPSFFDPIGWLVLKYYAPCRNKFSFHFKKYDQNIFTPVIRGNIRRQEISHNNHITVYLPAYGDKKLIKVLSKVKKARWEVFSKHSNRSYTKGNVKIYPISEEDFGKSMASGMGVLCGAGFETPAEAMFLAKKLMVIPMRSQYEQHYNAESLKSLGVPVMEKLNKKNVNTLKNWIRSGTKIAISFPDETHLVIDKMMEEISSYQRVEHPTTTFSRIFSYLKFKLS